MRYPETARFIRKARAHKGGMSQEKLARAIGSSRLQVIRWEQGLHRPDLNGLGARLCEVLEVDVADLARCDEDDEEAALDPFVRDLAAMLNRAVDKALDHRLKDFAA